MASAQVVLKEIDITTRVPAFPGVSGAIVLAATRGDTSEAQLSTNEVQFLNRHTLYGNVDVGDDSGYYTALSYLQKSNRLWIKRVVGAGALYGGVVLRSREGADSTTTNTETYTFPSGGGTDDQLDLIVDGSASISTLFGVGTFSAEEIALLINESVAAVVTAYQIVDITGTVDGTFAVISTNKTLVMSIDDGTEATVTFSEGGSVANTAIVTEINAIFPGLAKVSGLKVELRATSKIDIKATSTSLALLGFTSGATANATIPFAVTSSSGTAVTMRPTTSLEIEATTTSDTILGLTIGALTSTANAAVAAGQATPTSYTFLGTAPDAECVFIYAKDEGTWNNKIAVKVYSKLRTPAKVKESNATFLIEVWRQTEDNAAVYDLLPNESFECSRVVGAKDGFGRALYVEDRLATSEYISALDNTAVANTVVPRQSTAILAFTGGSNGAAVTDGVMILGSDEFANPEDKDVTLIMDSGWTTPAYQLALLTLAQTRIGTLAIISTAYADESASTYLNSIVDYRKYTLNVNTSWGAMYTPHVKIYDKFNDRSLFISPTGFVGAIISATAAQREIWFPPAGFRRGVIQVLDTRRRFTKGEMDTLYDDGINPIRFAPGRGIVVWGNKTLLSRPSDLQSVHVRLLLIVIEPAIMLALEDYLFEINDTPTRNAVKSTIDTYMEGIKARRGVTDFLTVCDRTNNLDTDIENNRLVVWLFIKPAKAVEEIQFNVIVTREGMSFALAAEQL